MGKRLHALVHHPFFTACMGLLLVASGVGEVLEPFMDDIQGNEAQLGAHHGVTLFGVYTLLQAIGAFLSGAEDIEKGAHAVGRLNGKSELSTGQSE
jgi:hypothetical protein